jgi:hypothetical protein
MEAWWLRQLGTYLRLGGTGVVGRAGTIDEQLGAQGGKSRRAKDWRQFYLGPFPLLVHLAMVRPKGAESSDFVLIASRSVATN